MAGIPTESGKRLFHQAIEDGRFHFIDGQRHTTCKGDIGEDAVFGTNPVERNALEG